ncbi:LysE family translocator [Aliiglaciecola sp. M165]|uniref:LysE family translocator n=1 Tax=Aliiglaciecola sp. M165 TaxID=2593649 RepID=UPI00117EC353|nr:LysE family translocator [Aliiglaciecola sp. M165]TRY33767.1 LysE family translocator [Aliiglaciecola sp. M165]
MPSIDTLLAFSLAAALLSISPGPSNLYIMARTMASGHKSGVAAAGGMAVGSVIYVLATALGLAAIFKYSPTAYTLLKLAGAGYLIYLGIHAILASRNANIDSPKVKVMTNDKVFKQSILVELTNPKTALFFLAFLPQFVNPEVGSVALQLVILGLVYALIAFCSDLFVAFMSGQIGKWLAHHPLFIKWQDRISGSILIGLGGYIALEELTDFKMLGSGE